MLGKCQRPASCSFQSRPTELGVVKEGLSRHLGSLTKKPPKDYKGRAGNASKGNRPGMKSIWKEIWKISHFQLHQAKTKNNHVSPIINGNSPSAKSWGLWWKARIPSVQLQPSAATQKREPDIVGLMDFFFKRSQKFGF